MQVDVFTSTPTLGNALAVVLDGEGLSEGAMRRFAAWTNLAETTFLLPPEAPEADYRVRILTPTREMPFAGHPTLGSCAAWLAAGGLPKAPGTVRQECGVGIVEIDLAGEVPAFVAPPTAVEPLAEDRLRTVTGALGLDPARVVASARLDNGPVWEALELDSADAVRAVEARRVRWPEHAPIGLVGRQAPGSDTDFEVRMLAPSSGMVEDPITGSLNAALAHWLLGRGAIDADVTVAQGGCIGREGRVHVAPDPAVPGRVRIGGESHVLVEGTVAL